MNLLVWVNIMRTPFSPYPLAAGFLPVRTVPVLGLVLHVLLGLELRTALTGTEPREPVLYRYGTGTIIYM